MFNFDASSADTVPVNQQQFILPRKVDDSQTLSDPLPQTQTGFVGIVCPFKDSDVCAALVTDLAERNSIKVKFSSVSPNFVHLSRTYDKSGTAMVNYTTRKKPWSNMTLEDLRKQSTVFTGKYVHDYILAVSDSNKAIQTSETQLMPYSSATWTNSSFTLKAGVPVIRTFSGKPQILVDVDSGAAGFVYAIWAFATFEGIVPTVTNSVAQGVWPGVAAPHAVQQGGFIQTLIDVGSALLPIFGLLGDTTVFMNYDGSYSIRRAGESLTPFEKERSQYITTVNRQAEIGLLMDKRSRSRKQIRPKYPNKGKKKQKPKRNAPAKRKARNNQ